MSLKEENGHHELMDRMSHFSESSAQEDYLRNVAELAAMAEPEPGHELAVGPRVRQVREHKGLSLADLALRTGLEEALLAEIEEGASSPPLGILVKLGKALDMKLGTFLSSGEDRPYTVVRVSDRKQMSRFGSARTTQYGYSYQSLAPDKANRSMEPFLVTLHQPEEGVEPSSHDGEEFIFVMDGAMEAVVGDALEILGPGDSIYYDSTQPHLLRPHGKGPTLILAVIFHQGK